LKKFIPVLKPRMVSYGHINDGVIGDAQKVDQMRKQKFGKPVVPRKRRM
jgi:hypothetical protein